MSCEFLVPNLPTGTASEQELFASEFLLNVAEISLECLTVGSESHNQIKNTIQKLNSKQNSSQAMTLNEILSATAEECAQLGPCFECLGTLQENATDDDVIQNILKCTNRSPSSGMSTKWIVIIVSIVVLVAALAIGLGVGLTRRKT
jgi:hypothetical protein